MRNIKVLILLTTILSCNVFGQKSDSLKVKLADNYLFSKRNSINFEAFGHGLFYSLSYERILFNGYHFKLAGQAGIAVYPYPAQIDIWLPISFNAIKTFGAKRRNHIELGVGHVARYDELYAVKSTNPWQTFLTSKLGYRYQKPNGHWIYKILFTPFYEYDRKSPNPIQIEYKKIITFDNPYASGALSIGYAF